ncbi:MAG: transcription antitermination factor NusB [Ornithinimicrobium sp.]
MAQRPRSVTRPAERTRHSDPARHTAYLTMHAVARGAYANLELPDQLRRARISGRDAAFATELCYGTIRMQGLYDAIIAVAAQREVEGIDPSVLDIVRLGVHQVLGMRVPDHAAVNASVALARSVASRGAGGFVNAVLRRVTERSREEWIAAVTVDLTDTNARLGAEFSHPLWIVRALRAALLAHRVSSPDTISADLAALLQAQNRPGALTLAARPGLGADVELREAGAEPLPAAPTAWTLSQGDPGMLQAIRDGAAAVQDAGSQLVAAALASAPVDGDGGRWLDLCAGPGGKAGLLAAFARPTGASLRANELSEHRAELVRHTLRAVIAAGASVEITVGDGTTLGGEQPDYYDRVLVDAPCTGLGALRRRSEARWRRQPSDLTTLAPLQRALLTSALSATRPGGVVVYATCSPHIAETTVVVEDVSRSFGAAQVEDVRPFVKDRFGTAYSDLGAGPWAQLWPHLHDTDGMFLAALRRT